MTNEEKVTHWMRISDNDIVAAEAMVKAGQNLYAGFMCQQAVEKALKAYFIKAIDENHPFIHDLERLAKMTGLYESLSGEQVLFLERLSPLYIEARYNDYKMSVSKSLTNDVTKNILEQTKEFTQWLKKKM